MSLAGWGSPVLALSPDGRLLAIVGMKDRVPKLFVHRLDRDETIEVPDSNEAEGPFFSPDAQWIAFAVGVSMRSGMKGELKKYLLATGLTQSIAEIRDFFGGVWRDDGTILFMGANGAHLQERCAPKEASTRLQFPGFSRRAASSETTGTGRPVAWRPDPPERRIG